MYEFPGFTSFSNYNHFLIIRFIARNFVIVVITIDIITFIWKKKYISSSFRNILSFFYFN